MSAHLKGAGHFLQTSTTVKLKMPYNYSACYIFRWLSEVEANGGYVHDKTTAFDFAQAARILTDTAEFICNNLSSYDAISFSSALSVAFAFCLFTAYKLRRASHKQESS